MTQLQIVCNNCGAKYRLPETFQNDHAKCKQCGSVIDVKSQRQPAAAPAAAKPAAARQATARTARSERKETGHGGERHTRRHHGADKPEAGGEGHGRHHRHGHEPAEKKGGMGLMIGSGIGLLALVVVGVVWFMNSGDTPATTPSAQTPPAVETTKPSDAAATKETPKPQDADVKKPDAPVVEAPKVAEPAKPVEAPKAAEPELPPGSPAWMKSKVTAMDEVFDPKTLTPVAWPEAVTAEQQKQVQGLLDDIEGGGKPGIGAKKELEELGWVGFAGIVNRLREIDYKDPEQSMFAFELNKILENITITLNTGFATVNAGEDIDPRKVDFNAKTAKAWQGLTTRFPTPESLEEHRKKAQAEKKGK